MPNKLSQFWQELKRRNEVRVVTVYAGAAFVILSWIYDIHPEGGLVKTEPADKIKPEDITKSSNGWKIASYISFMGIVVKGSGEILPVW